jgi:hypothetical protein
LAAIELYSAGNGGHGHGGVRAREQERRGKGRQMRVSGRLKILRTRRANPKDKNFRLKILSAENCKTI